MGHQSATFTKESQNINGQRDYNSQQQVKGHLKQANGTSGSLHNNTKERSDTALQVPSCRKSTENKEGKAGVKNTGAQGGGD